MPFSEISDPRGMCENVADLGRWGNGDVEVGFSDMNDLSYVMSLVYNLIVLIIFLTISLLKIILIMMKHMCI